MAQINSDGSETSDCNCPLGRETYDILGACFEVYNIKGCGFHEPVYQECLEIEFPLRGIKMQPQAMVPLEYKGVRLRQHFVPDFICSDEIVLEIKAVSQLTDEHRAQLLNYLNATGYEVGLLANFGHHPGLQYERMIVTNDRKRQSSHLRASV